MHGTSSAGIVSWVDIVLARLGEAIMVTATGFHDMSLPASMPAILRRQRDEDALWAASQLPGTLIA
jgi:hypothetical protein